MRVLAVLFVVGLAVLGSQAHKVFNRKNIKLDALPEQKNLIIHPEGDRKILDRGNDYVLPKEQRAPRKTVNIEVEPIRKEDIKVRPDAWKYPVEASRVQKPSREFSVPDDDAVEPSKRRARHGEIDVITRDKTIPSRIRSLSDLPKDYVFPDGRRASRGHLNIDATKKDINIPQNKIDIRTSERKKEPELRAPRKTIKINAKPIRKEDIKFDPNAPPKSVSYDRH